MASIENTISMSDTKKKIEEKLFEAVADALIAEINSGECRHQSLEIARRFLSDNGVNVSKIAGGKVDEVEKVLNELPFQDPETEIRA